MNPAYDLLNCKQHSHQISFLFRAWCNAILFLLLIIHYLLLKKLVGLCFPLLMSDTRNVLLNTFKGNQYHFHIIQISANNWGKCLGGGKAVGCGPQETFRNCADVQIYSNAVGLPPTAINHPNTIYSIDETAPGDEKPTTTLWVKSKRSKIVSFFWRDSFHFSHQICMPAQLYSGNPGMTEWCQQNCQKDPSGCTRSKCTCWWV